MKKIIILLLAVAIFTACNDNPLLVKDAKSENKEKVDKSKEDGEDDYKKTKTGDDDEDYRGKKGDFSEDDEDYSDDDGYNTKTTDYEGGSSWSKTDRNQFMKTCINSFTTNQAMGKKVCPCVLEKLQDEYKNLAEADRKGGSAAGERTARQCLQEMGIGTGGGTDGDDDEEGDY